jgi:predicted SAM-dependent methyltransferase
MVNKLHLGCGKRYLDGYIHVDIAEYDHIDYKTQIDKLEMFESNFADLIYASHCIEYFDRDEVKEVLSEWKRVLKPGGVLRLAVPDFSSLIKIYSKTKDLSNVLGPLYGKWDIGEEKFIYHKTVYDMNSLTAELKNVGFQSVKKWDWRAVFKNDDNFDDHSQAYFPHMDKEKGLSVSLNLQCLKPNNI